MAPVMIGHPRLGQATARGHETVDPPFGHFTPADVEGEIDREKAQRRIRQMIVNPPRELGPVAGVRETVDETGDRDAGGCPAIAQPLIPRAIR
jgi:hypothetical protein